MKLFDRVEILIGTDNVPRGCRGVVVDVLEPDGCCVEFFDDEDNTIDVVLLSQRDLALVKLIDRDAVRAELERLEWDSSECKHKSGGRLDSADRRKISVREAPTRVDNICSECGTAKDETKPKLTLGQYLLSAPRGDELEFERSHERPMRDPFAEDPESSAEPGRESPVVCGAMETLGPLARDYVEGCADAVALLAELEAAQLDIGEEDDEQEPLAQFLDATHGKLDPGSFGGV